MSSNPITGVFNDGYISEAYEAYRREVKEAAPAAG